MYNWITLLYSRNEHNIVNQLYFNKKKKLKKRKTQTQNIAEDHKGRGGQDMWAVLGVYHLRLCNEFVTMNLGNPAIWIKLSYISGKHVLTKLTETNKIGKYEVIQLRFCFLSTFWEEAETGTEKGARERWERPDIAGRTLCGLYIALLVPSTQRLLEAGLLRAIFPWERG